MTLLKVLVVLCGLLVQSVVAMVIFEAHRYISPEPMPGWYPWMAYLVGGGFGGMIWWSGLVSIVRRKNDQGDSK